MKNKIHLGCGKRFLEGYIHVDIDTFDHIDFVTTIDNLEMFEDDSANLIYCSHAIEYFDMFEINNVLREWKRVLCPGGILRLAVPNFETLIEIYKNTKDLNSILGPLYGKWDINDSGAIYHKTVYDKKLLSQTLIRLGFEQVEEWDWREVFKNHEGYDDHSQAYYPHMDKEKGIHVSLNIQATKPNN